MAELKFDPGLRVIGEYLSYNSRYNHNKELLLLFHMIEIVD